MINTAAGGAHLRSCWAVPALRLPPAVSATLSGQPDGRQAHPILPPTILAADRNGWRCTAEG
jgi:hypothetical protein